MEPAYEFALQSKKTRQLKKALEFVSFQTSLSAKSVSSPQQAIVANATTVPSKDPLKLS